ncbi:uncharacterized protein LOC133817033 [Humulus lupulus]|uniref:uncharacterized protein LOC133817033 n=1 Tax=Humulus lupulus TaxID=3486 RepID=UPI002B413B9D|nr:uncharacterized protein LOC133817033 [Humulus lupulus]
MKTLVYKRLKKRQKVGEPYLDMSTIDDDILLEIFLRLADFKCIVECALVCKRWFSAIANSKAYFSLKFNHYHRQNRLNNSPNSLSSSPSLPYTLLFRGSYKCIGGLPHYRCLRWIISSSSFEFFSERSKILDYGKKMALEFLNWVDYKDYAYVWSSFEDLLLIERSPKQLYICNPLSRQSVALPEPPNAFHQLYRYALVVLGYDDSNMIKYKVVKISRTVNDLVDDFIYIPPPSLIHIAIFCSVTRQWSCSTFNFPIDLNICHHHAIVGSNGIVYWPYGSWKFKGIAALNPHSKQCRLIGLPPEFGRGWGCKLSRARVGVVRGRLRLAQLFWCKKKQSYVFKAWELVDEDGQLCSWNVVHHHDQMMMGLECGVKTSLLTILALHPDDGDVFFFSSSSCNLGSDDIEVFQCRLLGQNHNHIESLCHLPPKSFPNASVVPLVHPWWPNQIPLCHPSNV